MNSPAPLIAVPGLANFAHVIDDLYRGAAPSSGGLFTLWTQYDIEL